MKTLNLKRYKKYADFSELCGHRIAHWQSLNFNDSTDKETILFIHGFPNASWDWHFQWKYLAQHYRLISLDMLGFGLSAKPLNHQYSLLAQANIVETLLAEKGIKECHILAHDYGNSVAQELLSRQQLSQNSIGILSICFLNGALFSSHHRPLFIQNLLKSSLGSFASRLMHKSSLERRFSKIFGPNTQASQNQIDIVWQLLEYNRGRAVLPKLLTYIDERKVHKEFSRN